ncbi:hypothetical protein [Clostridium botulinum]|uniref:hypothetical protein n=1 Tax=Clostridium botulinum TaxID=1491 RepID=UPI000A17122C|nr:hypothetical protein [Clostridium botulinum]OSA79388.1 hypothetical protein B2H89_13055 [Clostridium botulinum]
MKDEKLRIIYAPSFFISNPKILTSLCILYDEVILFNSKSIDEENRELDKIFDLNQVSSKDIEKSKFINGTLNLLSSENIIKVYTSENAYSYFSKTGELETGFEFEEKKNKKYFKVDYSGGNNLTKNIVDFLVQQQKLKGNVKVSDMLRATILYGVSEAYKIPVVSFNNDYDMAMKVTSSDYVRFLSDNLALMSICELALPEMVTTNPEDIVIAREQLKNELIEFRAGILELTYTLYQTIGKTYNYNDIAYECSMLINTKIKSSIMSLENKIRHHKNSKIKKLLLFGGKLLMTGGNLLACSRETKDLLESGKSFFDTFSAVTNLEKPEHRIGSFIIKLDERLKVK